MKKFKKYMKNGIDKLKNLMPRYKDLSDGWKGGLIVLTTVTLICVIFQGYKLVASHGILDFIIGTSLVV